MKAHILDLEANGLRKQASEIHCVVIRDTDGGTKEFINVSKEPESLRSHLIHIHEAGEILVGHNILGYDLPVLSRLVGGLPFLVSDLRVVDTLVLSRLLAYKIQGGHSLAAWGERFGIKKEGKDITDWSVYTPLMLERCLSDTAINLRLYQKFERFVLDPKWREALVLEHRLAQVCLDMEDTGLPFNVEAAKELRDYLKGLLEPIDAIIARDFKPKAIPIREVTPRITKDGSLNRNDFRWWEGDDLTCFDGGPFTVFKYQEFNPGSHKQVVERLNEAGWKPTEKTDGHTDAVREKRVTEEHLKYGWKVSEENLKTLPESAPEGAFALAKRIVLSSRLSDLEEWLALVGEDGRLHPTFQSIGAWTQRLAHQNPNCANIPASKPSNKDTDFQKQINDINARMRALFYAPKGWRLVGTDADGIQMRIFAHVIEDERLIKALVEGKKEDGTDIHTLHQGALGATAGSRDEAKTFIYAFLLGAGVGRVSEIFQCTLGAAKTAINNFFEFYPGLKNLKKTLIPQWAKQGYFEGLDGRKVPCDSEHLMLAGILQCGEKVIMGRAMLQWMEKLRAINIPFQLVNWVHDEWQTLIPDDDDICREVQTIQIESIRDQGRLLNLNCPTEGTSSWGYNWQETH